MPLTRRQLLTAALGGVAAPLIVPRRAVAQDDKDTPSLRRDETDAALDRAVAYLRATQTDEGWINDGATNRNAMTALALMAMASLGHTPADQSATGKTMRQALDHLLRDENQDDQGYFGARDASRMYGHGIITLTLAELIGMSDDDTTDKLILKRLDKALQLILRAQKRAKGNRAHQGGWRYYPDSADSDLSISVWQAMALRSAKNAGLDVPSEAIDDAVGYLERSYLSRRGRDGKPTDRESGFGYMPGQAPSYSATAAGMLALQVCGKYDADEVKGAADWLMKHHRRLNERESWFYYGTYYYAQAMYQRGGRYAEHARSEVQRVLLPLQRKDGAWPRAQGGQVYATCLAVLSLSVKYHYLPIYQR